MYKAPPHRPTPRPDCSHSPPGYTRALLCWPPPSSTSRPRACIVVPRIRPPRPLCSHEARADATPESTQGCLVSDRPTRIRAAPGSGCPLPPPDQLPRLSLLLHRLQINSPDCCRCSTTRLRAILYSTAGSPPAPLVVHEGSTATEDEAREATTAHLRPNAAATPSGRLYLCLGFSAQPPS